MKFPLLDAAKFVAAGVVGIGAQRIVKQVIKSNVEEPEKLIDKVPLVMGSWALAGVVGAAAKQYTDEVVDGVARTVTKARERLEKSEKLAKVNRGESTLEKEGLEPEEFEQEDVKKNGKTVKRWTSKTRTKEQKLAKQLEDINAGTSTFKIEGLNPQHFYQNSVTGRWEKILENDSVLESTK